MALCKELPWNNGSKALLLLPIKPCHSGLGGLSFPLAQAHHLSTLRYNTQSPRPQTWGFYKEQDTWELESHRAPTSLGPPRLLKFGCTAPSFHREANQPKDGAGATSCPRGPQRDIRMALDSLYMATFSSWPSIPSSSPPQPLQKQHLATFPLLTLCLEWRNPHPFSFQLLQDPFRGSPASPGSGHQTLK